MGPRAAFTVACCTGALVLASAAVSCGARTGLLGEPEEAFDAGFDAASDSGPGKPDALTRDAPDDLPAIDLGTPDAPIFNPCPDAAATLVYVIDSLGTLYSYDPPTGVFMPIGTISCPDAGATTPFSMAVNREGVAYVEFGEGLPTGQTLGANLYRVSTKTASCTSTKYDPVAHGRVTFGMSFVGNAGDAGDGGETLFIAEQPAEPDGGRANDVLATIDTTTFDIQVVGSFTGNVENAELTGTGDGRLFAFYSLGSPQAEPSIVGQIDPTTAQVTAQDTLPLAQGNGWAFGFWGGAFYLFTTQGEEVTLHTIVSRFDPVDGTLLLETRRPDGDIIVGAGVSTCAPSQ